MVNEATLIESPTRFARRTVAYNAAIPYGTLMKLTTPNTASASGAAHDIFGGICWVEKTNVTDTSDVEIVVALDGVWAILCSAGAITIGQDVVVSGVNTITVFTNEDNEKGEVVGKPQEGGAGSTIINVRVNCQT